MFKNLFKKDAPMEQETTLQSSDAANAYKIQDYFGRFTLSDIDNEIDLIKLNKTRSEVRLDYENNRLNYETTMDVKNKKHMNFCRFMLSRIDLRIGEITSIQASNSRLLQRINKTPDKRWQSITKHIVELYPGINLEEIILKVDA